MPLHTVEIVSQVLQREVTYNVLLPDPVEVGPGPYPALIQLHGYWGNHNDWLQRSRIFMYVKAYPMIVVFPAGENSFYANIASHLHFEDFIAHELPEQVRGSFPVRQGKWAIGGLSMGGFGTIRLGLKYPDKFCSVFAHSSRIPDQKDENFIWSRPEFSEEFRKELKSDLDCYRIAERLDRAQMPRFSFDCGTEDFLLEDNRKFHGFLNSIGLPHHYAEYPGEHDWDYWDKHVQEAIRQHAEVFGIKPVAPKK